MIALCAVSAVCAVFAVSADSVPRAADRWVSADKFQHAAMSYSITAFSFGATRSEPASIASAAVAAIAKEIYDKRFSFKDLIWDAVGIAAGYAVIKQAR